MSKWLDNLNPRERRLAGITAGLIAVAAVFLLGRQAVLNLSRLQADVAQAEQELENLTRQYVQRGAVDAAYRRVVKQHSSELTKQEIHDNLRREIYRLATVQVPGGKGGGTRQLVRIPRLPGGQLNERGEGFREYAIRFNIPAVHIVGLVQFLERVEASEQFLRIDTLEIRRRARTPVVEATVGITRTVLDDPDAPQEEQADRRSTQRPDGRFFAGGAKGREEEGRG